MAENVTKLSFFETNEVEFNITEPDLCNRIFKNTIPAPFEYNFPFPKVTAHEYQTVIKGAGYFLAQS
jgi:hypothetical protein